MTNTAHTRFIVAIYHARRLRGVNVVALSELCGSMKGVGSLIQSCGINNLETVDLTGARWNRTRIWLPNRMGLREAPIPGVDLACVLQNRKRE